MGDDELVDGAGWISEESSFYGTFNTAVVCLPLLILSSGDEETVAMWEDNADRMLELSSERIVRPLRKKPKLEAPLKEEDDFLKAASSSKGETNVRDFLKSRPQSSKLQRGSVRDQPTSAKPKPRTLASEEASEMVHCDNWKGRADAWQQNEPIDVFLKRLPITDPNTAIVGPWLWVSSPRISRSQQQRRAGTDVDAFVEVGEDLKETFLKQKANIEAANRGKPPATITRKLNPYRDQLEGDLLSAAVATGMPLCLSFLCLSISSHARRVLRTR